MQHYFSRKILPAVSFEDALQASKVAEAIKNGGLQVMEVPFRTTDAPRSIQLIREHCPEMCVGAGTILTLSQLHEAKQAGAQFGLAPGFNPVIVKEAAQVGFPFIPGVMTPSEIEQAIELSCFILKIFPVSQAGGVEMLKALAGPYKHTGVKFIPMGGINQENMRHYLEQENVLAIGGSWLAPRQCITSNNYSAITSATREAVQIAEYDSSKAV